MSIKFLNSRITIFVSLLTLLSVEPCLAKKVARHESTLPASVIKPDTRGQLQRWEVRTAPLALFANWLTLDLSYRFSAQWATGPAIVSYSGSEKGNMFLPSTKGSALGWNANYYFNSVVRNTWYASLHAYRDTFISYPHAYLGHKEFDGFRANTDIGYQWRGSVINWMVGLGAEYRDHQITTKPSDESDEEEATSREAAWIPHLEFKVGYEF